MHDGHTHYTPATGIAELRTAVARCYRRPTACSYTPEQVIVSNGAKHSIHNALAATVGPGDEVIIPTPYWVSYSDLVQMTGATYVLVPTTLESGFKMTPAQLAGGHHAAQRAADAQLAEQPDRQPSTRGTSWKRWPTWSCDANLGVLSDEIYEQLVFGDAKATCFATLRPGLAERTHHDQRREQDLRHDRLAHRLGGRAGARHQGDGQRAEPGDELPVQRQPVRGAGGPRRRPGVRREDAPRVRGAARPGRAGAWPRCPASAARCPAARSTPSSTSRPTSAARWAARRSPTRPASAPLRLEVPTSTWCPARRSAPRVRPALLRRQPGAVARGT